MMPINMSFVTAAFVLVCAPACADTLAHALQQDGPWIDLPDGVVVRTTAPTYDDIVAMADLDGNPDVITEDEQRMILLLSEVLMASPITQ